MSTLPGLLGVMEDQLDADAADPETITKCCDAVTQHLMSLRRLRLGQHERWILCQAAEPASGAVTLTKSRTARSLAEGRLRAARKLRKARLIEWATDWDDVIARNGWRRTYWRRTANLTDVGRVVVRVLGKVLATNRPIRWARYWAALEAEIPALGAQLEARREQAAANLRSHIERAKEAR